MPPGHFKRTITTDREWEQIKSPEIPAADQIPLLLGVPPVPTQGRMEKLWAGKILEETPALANVFEQNEKKIENLNEYVKALFPHTRGYFRKIGAWNIQDPHDQEKIR